MLQRLIHEQKSRIDGERTSNSSSLPDATRELMRVAALKACELDCVNKVMRNFCSQFARNLCLTESKFDVALHIKPGKSAASWKSKTRSVPGPLTSFPPAVIFPLDAVSRPATMFKSVDVPQPLVSEDTRIHQLQSRDQQGVKPLQRVHHR